MQNPYRTAVALDITSSGLLGVQGSISNAKTIRIYGTLRNDATSSSTHYSISGTGSLSLLGGTIGTQNTQNGWIFNQNVSGYGTISAPVVNNATVTASGGTSGLPRTLTISGNVTNTSGTLAASQYNTLALQGNTVTSGQINPGDGTVSLSGATLTNTTLGTGNLTVASGTNAFTGTTTSAARLGITSGATLNISGTLTQSGPVTNAGTVNGQSGSTVVLYSSYNSNISGTGNQTFHHLTIESTGYLVGNDDKFTISGNFLNYSTQNSQWNTTSATLSFTSGPHQFALPGLDLGQVPHGQPNPGYTDNFAWDTLEIASGGSLTLLDGNSGNGSTALYVGIITGLVFKEGKISNITGNFNIYYDPQLNPGLNYASFDYASGSGKLMSAIAAPVPLPNSVWLLGTGLIGLLLVSRRIRRRR